MVLLGRQMKKPGRIFIHFLSGKDFHFFTLPLLLILACDSFVMVKVLAAILDHQVASSVEVMPSAGEKESYTLRSLMILWSLYQPWSGDV